jgi:hypothetical protein
MQFLRAQEPGRRDRSCPLRRLCRFLILGRYSGSRPGAILTAAWDRWTIKATEFNFEAYPFDFIGGPGRTRTYNQTVMSAYCEIRVAIRH